MGFNVYRPGNPKAFVTASHCVPNDPFTGGLGAILYQNGSSASNPRGFVLINPPWFTGADCLPTSTYCTYADVALVQWIWGPDVPRVVQTSPYGEQNNTGTLWVDPPDNRYISQEDLGGLPVGWNVFKTGQTTGTTHGPTSVTCATAQLNADAQGTVKLEIWCAGEGKLLSQNGDSGGPVFRWINSGTSNRSAVGIVFGSYLHEDQQWRLIWSNYGQFPGRLSFFWDPSY